MDKPTELGPGVLLHTKHGWLADEYGRIVQRKFDAGTRCELAVISAPRLGFTEPQALLLLPEGYIAVPDPWSHSTPSFRLFSPLELLAQVSE